VAAVFAVILPGLDLNGTRVSNDALAARIGGLIVLLAVRLGGDGWSWRRAALVGVLLGVGLMAKLTLAGLVPAWSCPRSGPAVRPVMRTCGA